MTFPAILRQDLERQFQLPTRHVAATCVSLVTIAQDADAITPATPRSRASTVVPDFPTVGTQSNTVSIIFALTQRHDVVRGRTWPQR